MVELRAVAAALALSALGACSGSEPAEAGQACFRALDCRAGLVCVQGACSAEIDVLVPEGAGQPVDAGR